MNKRQMKNKDIFYIITIFYNLSMVNIGESFKFFAIWRGIEYH